MVRSWMFVHVSVVHKPQWQLLKSQHYHSLIMWAKFANSEKGKCKSHQLPEIEPRILTWATSGLALSFNHRRPYKSQYAQHKWHWMLLLHAHSAVSNSLSMCCQNSVNQNRKEHMPRAFSFFNVAAARKSYRFNFRWLHTFIFPLFHLIHVMSIIS